MIKVTCYLSTLCSKKVHLFIFLNNYQKLTDFNNFWLLNPEKILHEHLADLSSLPVRCSHFTLRNPKKSFFNNIHFRLFTLGLSQKKTNSNCCTAALAVKLLLFSASYYYHNPSTASGAGNRRSACIDMDVLRQRLVVTWAAPQYRMV